MRKWFALALLLPTLLFPGCKGASPDAHRVTMLIESSPANLDPRIGTDAQSERIYELIFDALLRRDEHFELQPDLAERWENPDPVTWVFHLRHGVHFHDGRLLTSKDVKWTLDSIHNGTIVTAKTGAFQSLDHVEAPTPDTVVVHLKNPDNYLLPNLSNGAIGIVPEGAGADFWKHPIGTGPFRFLHHEVDKEVLLERNPGYWNGPAHIAAIRLSVVPDAITRALELQKGSADVAVNAVTPDMVESLQAQGKVQVESGPGTILNYLAFNTRDPLLHDVRVRQAIAYGINRPLLIQSLWRGRARQAESLLPEQHWAWTGDLPRHPYNPELANRILDQAGYRRGADGVRFHLTMKTSTDETPRLLAIVLQQQLRQVGIALEVRSFEFATFYADITRGAFQMYTLRWIGGNERPDIFSYAFSSSRFPPKGANRGYYSNPKLDKVLDEATQNPDQSVRKRDYAEAQQILAEEVPAMNLWYLDTVVLHTKRLTHVTISPSGDYNFLRTAELVP